MDVSNVTDLRTELQHMLDHVHYTKKPLLVSKRGKPWVMIQPLPEDDQDLRRVVAAHEAHIETSVRAKKS